MRKITPQDKVMINGEEVKVLDILMGLRNWMDTNFVCTTGNVNMINNEEMPDFMDFPRMSIEDCKKNNFSAKGVLLYNAFALGFNVGMETERREAMGVRFR